MCVGAEGKHVGQSECEGTSDDANRRPPVLQPLRTSLLCTVYCVWLMTLFAVHTV